jgi:hypothetical protein
VWVVMDVRGHKLTMEYGYEGIVRETEGRANGRRLCKVVNCVIGV